MKLKLINLYMKDFKNVREASIDFPEGKIVYFSGDNAQGKSTVLEALALVLGDFKKGDTYKDFVNWDEDSSKKATVKFNGEVNGEPIFISVEISENSTSLVRYCEYKGEKKNGSDVLTLLSKLEIDYFSDIVFYLQSTADITKMGPSELAKSLQKLLNFSTERHIKIIESLEKPLENKLLILKSEIDHLKTKEYPSEKPLPQEEVSESESNQASQDLITLTDQLTKAFEEVEKQKLQVQEKEQLHKDIETINQQISEKEIKKASLKEVDKTLVEEKTKAIEKDYQEYTEAKSKIKPLNISQAEYEKEQNQLEDQKTSLETDLRHIDSERAHLKTLEELSQKITIEDNVIHHLEEVIVETNLLVNGLENDKTQLQNELESIQKEQDELNSTRDLEKETKRVVHLINEGKCPHCGQPTKDVAHSINFEDKLGWIGKSNNEIDQLIQESEKKRKEIEEKKGGLIEKLGSIDKEKASKETTIKIKEEEKKGHERDLEELKRCKEEEEKKGACKGVEIDEKEKKIRAEIEEVSEKIRGNQEKINEIITNKKIETSKVEALINKYQLSSEEKETDWSKILKEGLEEEVSEANKGVKKEKEGLEKEINDLNTSLTLLKEKVSKLNISAQEGVDISKIQSLISEKRDKIEKRRLYLIELKGVEEFNSSLTQEKKNDEASLASKLKEIKESSDLLALYSNSKTEVGKNLPNYLTVEMCTTLEKIINDFLQVVFPSMIVKLEQNKKGVSFFYKNTEKKTRKNVTVKMASGMEAQVLSIAWRVALSRAYGLNILFLDEVDSNAADSSSLKIFGELFSDASFDQFVVISHKQEVIRELKSDFDNICCYVVKNGKFGLEI